MTDAQREREAVVAGVAAPALYAALVEAKREMWMAARQQWNLSDFNNWAVIQQINAALTQADGKPRGDHRKGE